MSKGIEINHLSVKLEIIYEDEFLIICNKASGLHSISLPSSEKPTKSIAQLVSKQYPTLRALGDESGLLQRLDFETSGCLLIARSESVFNELKKQIKDHAVTKEYLFLADSIPPELTNGQDLEAIHYLGSRYRRSKKTSVSDSTQPRFQLAKTTFSLEKILNDIFLLRAKTNYGRRHQIRAQASRLGMPLLGDSLYGSKKEPPSSCPAFTLHAESISFTHPISNKKLKICAELPKYLESLL